MLTMYKQITIQTLHKQGIKKSQIAHQLGCHRNTVNNVLERKTVSEKQTRVKSSIFDPYKDKVRELHEQKVTRVRIYEILTEEYGLHVSYDTLRKYVTKHFPKPVEAFGVQVTEPGEEAELDFGYLGMLPGPSGKLSKTYGFAVVLPYSRLGFYAITYDQKLETLTRELTRAFVYFGGVPKRLKVDNMKTAILKNRHYDLEFNQDFLEFANHYGTVIIPCTPYSPEQKGKVESGIKYLQMNFVSGRTFVSDRDIAVKLTDWMDNYANRRVHGTTKKVPYAVFEQEEKANLQFLPDTPFAFFNRSIRKVAPNCHIHFENNYYSVPFALVGKEVTVRFNSHLIRIIFASEQVALHARRFGKGEYITVRVHLPEHKRYSETEHQAKYEEKMREIGEDAHEYFRMLLKTKSGYWFQTVRAILGLTEQYGPEVVNLSLKRATYYQAVDVTTIKHILEKKLYLMSLEPVLPKIAEENPVMGRDLTYYTVIYDANSLPGAA
jgi:transposase